MLIHLQAAGTSFVLDARGSRPPAVLHWGAALGDLTDGDLTAYADAAVPAVPPSSLDSPPRLSLLPTLGDGWSGRPAFAGSPGRPRWELTSSAQPSPGSAILTLSAGPLSVTTEIELSPQGVLRLRHTLANADAADFDLGSLGVVLPVPSRAAEVLDFAGLWAYERQPQRTPLGHGVWSRETRHGRPGHDDPYAMMLGTPGFAFGSGEVWAVHLAWSGDKELWAERQTLGATVLGAGELLAPGEVRLAPGGEYTTPWTVAVYSADGIDGLSRRLHDWIRSRRAPLKPRPVVLNTWEAVYFDHSLDRLTALADAAAAVGVERFVLDDGWFLGRTDDKRALGDWTVDPTRWPDGLGPLIDVVHERGMEFGLWLEPEMVSPDSELARAHPDWILGGPEAATWRHQLVLDLAVPAAYDYLLDSISALLTTYEIAFVKWDHNRDLLQEGSAHRQTTALYRLLAELRRRFPAVEIESCASGGARIDLGILEHVDRFWTSDTNDALERQQIQRWTSVLMPPELLGSHVGAPTAHITGRTGALGFRLATSLFGHAGIEWDLTTAAPDEQAQIAAWVHEYKQRRSLLHSGTVVRSDGDDPSRLVHGVVSPDQRTALFALVTLRAPRSAVPEPVRFPGLDPDRRYTVRPLELGGPPRTLQDAPPPWLATGSVTLPGRLLIEAGLPPGLLTPQQAALFTVDAV
ncbi:alpha-galactosidase [Paractinoplanes lichenicola]|uniref:alpha-galactosidase n=1 Tax=Paractinoplanes lichenicola TaxID=2802976 RepID=A0ABS1VSZ5_9ACTN|nr:alpha-galactosidase [Actinoplanes lichenicola]MBL7257588.1 alpha-galactosidase [Actinoplanes lichenicola]